MTVPALDPSTAFPTYVSSPLDTAGGGRPPDAAGRGREFGARWQAEVRANLDGYTRLFEAGGASEARVRGLAERALDNTAAWAPALAEEIIGIAAGAGLEPWQAAAVNARTEILAALGDDGEGECSTAVVVGGDLPPRAVQTWDWHDHLRDAPLLWAFEPRPGHTVRTFTEFGVLGKIGVNSAGLGVHFNILRHSADHARIGVPVHVVARRILDEAATLEQAAELARSARTSASTVITVVTEAGVRALEICPEGVAEVGTGGILLHTNHFLDGALAAGERLGTERPATYARLRHLEGRLAQLGDPDVTTRARAMTCHAPVAPVCAHADPELPFDQRWETLAVIALDVATATMRVHRGRLCQVTESTWQTF
ncbi:C45 family autoproteolytic acyltransferase/hydrolase [Nonomuraea sp. ZG12]|uniref:C45 family autoproteolytic acyltransferase/hydolase n=1 Tax=Nonomuraea sp. ZG12 TaxID=3452207 RepID=UPI003F8C5A7F